MASCRDMASALWTKIKKKRTEGFDWWTLSSTGINVGTSLVGNAYWLGSWVDTVIAATAGEAVDVGIGLSWWAIGFGGPAAIVIAIGAAKVMAEQSLNAQDDQTAEAPADVRRNEPQTFQTTSAMLAHRMAPPEHPADETTRLVPAAEPEEPLVPAPAPGLTRMQKFGAACFAVTYTGENAATLDFVIQLAARDSMPLWARLLVKGGSTVIGINGAVADTRNLRKNLLSLNEKKRRKAELREVIVIKGEDDTVEGDIGSPRNPMN